MRYTMRMFYRDPRPYMEDYQVTPYMCDDTYGNPNVPLMMLVALTMVIVLNPTGGLRPRMNKK